jgi:hypothetical protein
MTGLTLVDAKMTRPNQETLMNTHLPRQLIAVAISLTLHALMIGGVAWLFGSLSAQISSEHCGAAGAAWVALA